MSVNALSQSASSGVTQPVVHGVIGGLVGGVVFGLMMQAQGMMSMVAMLARSESIIVGWLVHLLISAFIGAVYGVVAARLPAGWLPAVIGGVANGVIWWILGALILMPLMLGMNEMVFQVGDMQISSLIGHIIFGVIAAAVYQVLRTRG
jgi:uncharacterized membrane protein YagU involved in acid resistance